MVKYWLRKFTNYYYVIYFKIDVNALLLHFFLLRVVVLNNFMVLIIKSKIPVMKKIIVAALFLLAFTGVSFSQAAQPKATDPKPAATSTATHTKKDGTADMRYKENKDAKKAAPATTHTKKDGTPDKRYKENKPKTN